MPERAATHVITELAQIKALADPLRQRILAAFVSEPRTTKQVATLLEQPPTKLYHHVDLLEKAGLIELIETRQKRGTTEKYFQAIAHKFSLAAESLGGDAGSVLEETFATAFASAQREIRRAVSEGAMGEPKEGDAILALGSLHLAKEDLPLISDRIAEIASGLPANPERGMHKPYRCLVAIYRVVAED